MRPGMQTLLRLLRDQEPLAQTSESEWYEAARVAGEENILPWFAACMGSRHGQLPVSINQFVAAIQRQAQHDAFLWSATLKSLLATFHERRIPVVSLKGPWLAERLYGDAALRSYSDLDFLVRPCDWISMEALLPELGFTPLPADCRHRRWERGGIFIEMHLRLGEPGWFDLDEEQFWNHAVLSDFHGAPGWLLAPPDELRFLCVHAVHHSFERLSLPLDLHFAFQKLARPDRQCLSREDQNVLALCRMLAARLELHPRVPDAWPAPRALEAVAERVWQRSMAQPGRPTAWLVTQNFYLQLKSPQSPRAIRYVRLAWFLMRRIDAADLRFAAHLHLHRTWQVRMVRPIRLFIKIARLSRSNLNSLYSLFSGSIRGRSRIIPSLKGTEA